MKHMKTSECNTLGWEAPVLHSVALHRRGIHMRLKGGASGRGGAASAPRSELHVPLAALRPVQVDGAQAGQGC